MNTDSMFPVGCIYCFDPAPSVNADRWVRCNGQLLLVDEYSSLFRVIGKAYGGDGVETFAVPDLARAPHPAFIRARW